MAAPYGASLVPDVSLDSVVGSAVDVLSVIGIALFVLGVMRRA
jgi:hypothetical protein